MNPVLAWGGRIVCHEDIGQLLVPILLIVNAQCSQYGFYHLITSFHHPVPLRSIRGCPCFVELEHFTQFFHELVVKLSPLIAMQSLHHPVERDLLPEEHIHDSFRCLLTQRVQLHLFEK